MPNNFTIVFRTYFDTIPNIYRLYQYFRKHTYHSHSDILFGITYTLNHVNCHLIYIDNYLLTYIHMSDSIIPFMYGNRTKHNF